MNGAAQRVWIFANGDIPDLERLRVLIRPEDRLIAADGGYHHMQKLNLKPEAVIGDLDSLLPADIDQLRQMGVPLERYPVDKDETDLELAIDWALKVGFEGLFIAGALGGRLDQTLGNLSLLSRPGLDGKDVRLEDGTEQVFLIQRETVISGQAGDTVSLIPVGEAVEGVVTAGLKYPLGRNGVGETLFANRTRGISNVLLAERAEVRFTKGKLICILRRNER